MSGRTRIPGQTSVPPGAIRAGQLVFTSGVVCTRALAEEVPVADQIAEAVAELLRVLTAAGCSNSDVVKLDAYLGSADDFPAWNAEFTRHWRADGAPARTSTVCGFAAPTIAFEVSAVAVIDDV